MQTAFLADGQGALDLTFGFTTTTQYNQSFVLKVSLKTAPLKETWWDWILQMTG